SQCTCGEVAGVGEPGGILALLDLIEGRHRGAVEYDFRARFHLGLECVPVDVGWGQAIRLLTILKADPSSATAAALAGWSHPISREALALADLIDVQGSSKAGKKWKVYPRPWEVKGEQTRRGNAAGRTRAEVIDILRRFGHGLS